MFGRTASPSAASRKLWMGSPSIESLSCSWQPHGCRLSRTNISSLRGAKFGAGGKVDLNSHGAQRLARGICNGTNEGVGRAIERQDQPRPSAYYVPSLTGSDVYARLFTLFSTFAM